MQPPLLCQLFGKPPRPLCGRTSWMAPDGNRRWRGREGNINWTLESPLPPLRIFHSTRFACVGLPRSVDLPMKCRSVAPPTEMNECAIVVVVSASFPLFLMTARPRGQEVNSAGRIICHCKLEVEQHVQGGLFSQGSMVFPLDFSKYCIGA